MIRRILPIFFLISVLGGVACDSKSHSEPGKAAKAEDGYAEEEGHNHKEDEPEGHDHAHEEELDPSQLETKKCEHGILFIDCDECRAEVGAVKISSEIAAQLVKTEKAIRSPIAENLDLVGEIEVNRTRTVEVFPIVSGRVTKIEKGLGDVVGEGELLAIIHSPDYGKARLEYISAFRQYAIARENLDWSSTIHKNMKQLLKVLNEGGNNSSLLQTVQEFRIGKEKEPLICAVTKYRMAQAEHSREMEIIKSIRSIFPILEQAQDLKQVEERIHALKIGEWKGKLLAIVLRLKLATKNYEREKALVTSKVSTTKEFQEAENEYESARADYSATIETLSFWLKQRELQVTNDLEASLAQYRGVVEEIELDLKVHTLQAEKEYQEAQNSKAIAEKQLYLFGLSPQDISALLTAKEDGGFGILEIRSPIAGTIIAWDISQGQFVEVSRPLYTISDLSKVWVWCDVYERDLPLLRDWEDNLGKLSPTIKVGGYTGETFLGTVDYLAGVMDRHTRTVKMRIVADNQKSHLRPGMFVEIALLVPGGEDVTTVPENSVVYDEGKSFVFKHYRDDLWLRTNVKLGRLMGTRREILSGVSAGETIVTQGSFMLKSEILKNKMGSG